MELQTSIRKPVRCEGVGLHTGVSMSMVLSPAPPDHGIVFVVGPERVAVPVLPESLLNGHYATTIGAEGIQIQTVEHLLAAVRGPRHRQPPDRARRTGVARDGRELGAVRVAPLRGGA